MLVYKFPGTMIEYLEGKRYDYKTIEEDQLEEVAAEGWAATPAESELLATPVEVTKVDEQ